MVELGVEIIKKLLAAFLIVILAGSVFEDLLTFGDGRFQSVVVFSFYIYCAVALFSYSRHKLFHVLSIPVFTQFIQIFQKFSFTAGANSVWRLLPFIILGLYFAHFFVRNQIRVSRNQKVFILSWIVLQGFFLFISPNLGMIIGGGLLLYLITIPAYFVYLTSICMAVDFRNELEKYLCILFIILAFGTFGLIYFGAGYKGSDNLLASRNIADTNVTMAYFILIWPFALLYANRQKMRTIFVFMLACLFITIVVFSFSRGAVFLVLPYLIITLFLTGHFLKWLLTVVLVCYANWDLLLNLLDSQDLAYFWSLRFGDVFSGSSFWGNLQAVSGRVEIQQTAYELFLENPVTGHGIGSFEVLGPGFREAHSLYYTLLAEEGLLGAIYFYGLFFFLAKCLLSLSIKLGAAYWSMPIALLFYLVFNHTVGSVFVIIPGKSISVNCVAPVLLMCLYFYHRSVDCQYKD
jgi:O-antigen ligase